MDPPLHVFLIVEIFSRFVPKRDLHSICSHICCQPAAGRYIYVAGLSIYRCRQVEDIVRWICADESYVWCECDIYIYIYI